MEKLFLEKTHKLHVILWDNIVNQLKMYRGIPIELLPDIVVLKNISFEIDPRLQPYKDCASQCFACEYADSICDKCPIKWGYDMCMNRETVYSNFIRALQTNSVENAISLAEKIRDMPWKTEEEMKNN